MNEKIKIFKVLQIKNWIINRANLKLLNQTRKKLNNSNKIKIALLMKKNNKILKLLNQKIKIFKFNKKCQLKAIKEHYLNQKKLNLF